MPIKKIQKNRALHNPLNFHPAGRCPESSSGQAQAATEAPLMGVAENAGGGCSEGEASPT